MLNSYESSQWVNKQDRSFQYGDGAFTTVLVKQGKLQHWSYHQQRMNACLSALWIDLPDWESVLRDINELISTDEKQIIKLHISRGCGGRGYTLPDSNKAQVSVSRFDFPQHYHDWQRFGVTLGICQQKMGLNPLLAGHKHNNRLEQILLKREIQQLGYEDGLCFDLRDKLVETTSANVFWIQGHQLYTPRLTLAGVAGVMRRVILEQAAHLGLTVIEDDFSLMDIQLAQEIFMTNAIMEIVPVVALEQIPYAIGAYTQALQKRIAL